MKNKRSFLALGVAIAVMLCFSLVAGLQPVRGEEAADTNASFDFEPRYEMAAADLKITYNLGGGMWKLGYTPPEYFDKDVPMTLPDATRIEKTGNTFAGWYDNPYFTDSPPLTTTDGFKPEPTPLYAKWKVHKLTMEFGKNGNDELGTPVSFSAPLDYGETGYLRPCPWTKANYAFVGWIMKEGAFKKGLFKAEKTLGDQTGDPIRPEEITNAILAQENVTVTLTPLWRPARNPEIEPNQAETVLTLNPYDTTNTYTYKWFETTGTKTLITSATSNTLSTKVKRTTQKFECEVYIEGIFINTASHTIKGTGYADIIIGIIIAVLVLAAAGFVAFYIWKKKRNPIKIG